MQIQIANGRKIQTAGLSLLTALADLVEHLVETWDQAPVQAKAVETRVLRTARVLVVVKPAPITTNVGGMAAPVGLTMVMMEGQTHV